MTQKTVVITGVSSGIGNATARLYLSKGYRVFGSVRNVNDAQKLKALLGLDFYPLVMDVSKWDEIEKCAEAVRNELNGKPLDCLINNAGMALAGPLEYQNIQDIQNMFNVNVIGLINVTRAFLPMLKVKSLSTNRAGKVINISSVAGKISAPFLGAYASSKHAVEAISASFRRELMPYGVDVIIIGPGNVRTPIWNKAARLTEYDHTSYKKAYRNFIDYALEGEKKGMAPEQIAEVILKASEAAQASARYAPVAQKVINWILPRSFSDRTLDKIFYKNFKMGV